eukprot:gnl/TRDRNA2_/TRDRNA2_34434_c0_seq1.p1 gnl/TRDRNA2_/TRDRNA2_34434_c0~~gnl/TRDRNA2_/TRDRNA2_34434_c0_seq1.p1  ORF type:complete len:209 (+),score=36.76 gnl/TRDRNA2_/TRDRNA2_34434_c0_seq1:75-701(+)
MGCATSSGPTMESLRGQHFDAVIDTYYTDSGSNQRRPHHRPGPKTSELDDQRRPHHRPGPKTPELDLIVLAESTTALSGVEIVSEDNTSKTEQDSWNPDKASCKMASPTAEDHKLHIDKLNKTLEQVELHPEALTTKVKRRRRQAKAHKYAAAFLQQEQTAPQVLAGLGGILTSPNISMNDVNGSSSSGIIKEGAFGATLSGSTKLGL